MAGGKRDLTEGPIARTLFLFSIPILAGNILQSLNASINMIWIGRFLGENALAASSNATNIIFLAYSTFFGFGMAATVLVGQHVGRKDIDSARRAIGAAASLFLGIIAVLVAVGIGYTDKLLDLMGTPHEAMPQASAYLKASLATLPFGAMGVLLMMTMRGAGDAMTPLWFMILGAIIDTGLNPLLIAGMGPFPELGIVGSAIATLVSNVVSFVGIMIVIYVRDLPIRLRGAEWRYLLPEPALLRLIFTKGTAMGLQMLVMTFSGLVMIGLVNHGGVYATAAYGVAFQLWNYVQMPSMAIGAAVSSMAAQNIGAGRWDRVRSITNSGLFYNLLLTGTAITLVTWFDRQLLGLFLGAQSPSIAIAERIQVIAGWSLLFAGITMVLFGTIRGNGVVVGPLILMILNLLVLRLGFAILGQPWLGLDALWWAFPFSSVLNAGLAAAYYLRGGWKKVTLLKPVEKGEVSEAVAG